MKQNPFSIYDFLGYLIPGAVFLFLVYAGGVYWKWDFILNVKRYIILQKDALKFYDYFSVAIASYISGHFIAIISSIFIETFTSLKHDYPSVYLFTDKKNGYFFNYNKAFQNLRFKERIWRGFIALILFPSLIFDFILGNFFVHARKLPNPLIRILWPFLTSILNKRFKVSLSELDCNNGIEHDYFRLLYHFAYEQSEKHAGKMQNYVSLYGFCRNISMVFHLAFWVIFIESFLEWEFSFWVIIFSFMSYIFYLGFVKFYRRFTLEAIMAVCIIEANNKYQNEGCVNDPSYLINS